MNKLFNSTLENSLRVMLMLNFYKDSYLNLDRISILDFIVINGKSLNINADNLNGDNIFYLSEYASKRNEINETIKSLVFKKLIQIKCTVNGFEYQITDSGMEFVESLNSNYATDYMKALTEISILIDKMNDQQLMNYINSQK